MIRALEQIIEWRGKPSAIRCNNGPEYIAQLLIDWAYEQQITLLYIQLGKPTQNAYIERFNRMHSISVGDIIVGEDGTLAVVAPVGFVAFNHNPKMAA